MYKYLNYGGSVLAVPVQQNSVGSYLPEQTQPIQPVATVTQPNIVSAGYTPTATQPMTTGYPQANSSSQNTQSNLQKMGDQIKNGWSQMSFGDKANTIMGTVGSLMNAYNAYKANKLAKQQFAHAKEVHAKNWDAQRKQTNSQLEDRQRRRVHEAQASGRTTTSVADYMAKYGI